MIDQGKPVELFIASPDEWKGHEHGQWLLDRPGLFINFACRHSELEEHARRTAEFVAGEEPFLAYQEPHFGTTAYLMRAAAPHIFVVHAAKSLKVAASASQPGTRLLDAESQLPLVGRRP